MKEDIRDSLSTCAFCPKLCRYDCQVSSSSCDEHLHPSAKAGNFLLFERGELEAGSIIDIFLSCAGCLRCREFCIHEIDFSEVSRSVVSELYSEGMSHEKLLCFIERFLSWKNPFDRELGESYFDLVRNDLRVEGGAVCLFPGCSSLIEGGEMVGSYISLFALLGIDYVTFPDRFLCCGLPLFSAGLTEEFRGFVKEVIPHLVSYKVIVTPCPECLYSLKVLYPLFGFGLKSKIVSLSEFLIGEVKQNRGYLQHMGGGFLPPTIHDPCYAGRYLSIYEPPRQLIEILTGRAPYELPNFRERSLCCGGGGHLPFLNAPLSLKLAENLSSTIEFSGYGEVVTPCPKCRNQLKSLTGRGYEVYEMGEYLARIFQKG